MMDNAKEIFYNVQREHDARVAARNLTGWVNIIQKKMVLTLHLEKQETKHIGLELQKQFYQHMVNEKMSYDNVKIKYESMSMLYEEATIYANEMMRVNQLFFNAATLGPNLSRYMLTLEADVYAAKQRLDEMEAPIDYLDLYAEFVEKVNKFTNKSFANVGEMIDEYQAYPDEIFNKRKLTVIKKGRNAFAHPEEKKPNRDKLIADGLHQMKLILNKIT